MSFLALALALAVATSDSPPEPRMVLPSDVGAFSRIPAGGLFENTVLAFGVGTDTFTLASTGELRRYRPFKKSAEESVFPDWEGYLVSGWYFLAPEGLYLVLEKSDMEAGWAELYLMNPETLEVIHHREFPAFNFGPALVTSDALYVAGIGFLAALDRKALVYRWCHRDLYSRFSANAFSSLELDGKELKATFWRLDPTDTSALTVESDTGNLLEAPSVEAERSGRLGECPSPIKGL